MRALLIVAALCASCAVADEDPAPVAGYDRVAVATELGPMNTEGRPAVDASCVATTERFTFASGACVARVTVRFACAPDSQRHDWARVGVLCEGEVCAYDDVSYRCGAELARSFSVPCGAAALVGGATFDHPVTAADASCLSE